MARTHRSLFITIIVAAAAIGLGLFVRERWGLSVRGDLVAGVRFADSLEAVRHVEPPSAGDAVALLYLERARLGVGSPFRLIDYLMRDPLLSAPRRRLVANAILGRTERGHGYATPGDALNTLGARRGDLGLAHRSFIEATIATQRDPRTAELALRLAYQVAAVGGLTSPRAGAVSVAAIAQARDRALAAADARAVLAEARRRQVDAIQLVTEWRSARKLRVEKPLVDPATPAQERSASQLLPGLVAALERIDRPVPATSRDRTITLASAQAASLEAERRNMPPQAPVVVTLGGFTGYVGGAAGSGAARAARTQFLTRARNEERLAAEYVKLVGEKAAGTEVSLALLTSAVAMRPYAQERPWFPGDSSTTPLQLAEQLGLKGLAFDRNVPDRWRGYYTRMLADVVRDMRVVFPKLDLAGLSVRFGESPLRERALALHDPRTRTVYFPLATSAGAMAHELSHDLDWQAARAKWGAQNSYRTDRSVRQYRDGLAATVDRMSGTAVGRRRTARVSPGGDRPTEAFARGADWIVASALARRGIVNGYLSAVQDEWLTGYASATPPRRDTPQGDATMLALTEIATVAPDVRAWYEASYGGARRAGVAEAVRRTLVAPWPRYESRTSLAIGFDPWSPTARLFRTAMAGSGAWQCLLSAPSLGGNDRVVQAKVMEVAAGVRVRGLLERWGAWSERTASSWRFRVLGGGPWNPATGDSVSRELKESLLWRAARVDDGRPGTDLVERLERDAAWRGCARGDDR